MIHYCINIKDKLYYKYMSNEQCNYCISDGGVLEKCDKEENVAVIGGLILLPV
jgi:hypothetical protein